MWQKLTDFNDWLAGALHFKVSQSSLYWFEIIIVLLNTKMLKEGQNNDAIKESAKLNTNT